MCLNYLQGPQWATFAEQDPLTGFWNQIGPAEAYETIIFERGAGDVNHVALVDVTIDFKPGNAESFEQRCQEFAKIYQRHGKGMVLIAVTRFMGGGGRYLFGLGHTNRDAYQSTITTPEIRSFRQSNPMNAYAGAPPIIDQATVVKALVRQPVA